MPAPYSDDLRTKAIAAVKRGERKIDVSRMLNISRNTLDPWLKRAEQDGSCHAIRHYQQGVDTKSRTGKGSESLCNSMALKPKGKWRNCGERVSPSKTLVMRCKSLESVVKKDLRVL